MMAADVNHDLFIGPEGTRICVASNEDKTAKFIWSEVAGMRKRLDLKDEITRKNLAELTNDQRDITVLRMSGRSVNDGDNFYKVVQDEAWDCKTNELPEACERSCSTQPDYVYFIISTNGTVNNGWYDDQLAYANAWLNGEVEDLHYLPFLFEQDDDREIFGNDRDVWQKANPSLIYGVKKWDFIENNMIKAKVDKKTRLQLMCKDFNIKISNSEQWLAYDEYSYNQEPFTLEEFRHHLALGATDLSDTGDLTTASVLLCKAGSNQKYVVMQFFIPEAKLKDGDYGAEYVKWSKTINPVTGVPYVIVIKGNRIDQKVVADWYQMLRDKYEIETYVIGYDKWNGSMFEHWCDKKTGYGFNLEIIRQGKYLSFAMRSVERDLYDRLINYGDNPVLKYCFNNTSAEFDEKSDSIQAVKIEGQYSRKIDGVVTLIMLYQTLINNEIDFESYRR